MMDINERLMEIESANQLADLTAEVLAVENDLTENLNGMTTDYEQLDDKAKENRLNEILNIYYRQKYLLRIKESLNTFAARF
jgi:molecular chaperone HscB